MVAALTNEIIVINKIFMLAVNIRKPPIPYVLYKKAKFGLVYPVTPCYRPESRIVPPHQDSGPDGWFRGELDVNYCGKNVRNPEEQMVK